MEAKEAKLFHQLKKAKSQYENYTSVTKYTAIIDCIIHVGDLEKITVSRIVQSLEALYGDEVTNQNKQLKDLIYERFHKYQSYKEFLDNTEPEVKKRKLNKKDTEKPKKKSNKSKKKSKEPVDGESKKTGGLDRKVYVGPKLAELIGKINQETNELWNRKEITSHVWKYVKNNNLQNPKDGREVLVQKDEKFAQLFPSDMQTLSMFTMQKYLQKQISNDENHVFES
ncbi:hypothetical protein FOG51_01304 [Hanseniaspora uvarum]|nr:hypothetical protein FOG51_01304 [Hanseniaspora uvarum]